MNGVDIRSFDGQGPDVSYGLGSASLGLQALGKPHPILGCNLGSRAEAAAKNVRRPPADYKDVKFT